MERRDGFVLHYFDGETGKLLLDLPRDSARLLVCVELATGLGSNRVGLDRSPWKSDRQGSHKSE